MKKQFRSFENARKFAKSLKLKKQEDWKQYKTQQNFPFDLPKKPQEAYKNKGWKGWGNFLGTGNVHPKDKKFMSYATAKKFVKQTQIKSGNDYRRFCKTPKKPKDLPTNPDKIYKKNWKSWDDFLGSGIISVNVLASNWLDFEDAKKFARSLKLTSQKEWREYCRFERKPQNIPTEPSKVYKNKGWNGMADWLGTSRIPNQFRKYKSFEDARVFAHSLNLTGKSSWSKTTKDFPKDIPSHPERIYTKQWKDWGDWLGTGIVSVNVKAANWRSFDEARKIVRELAKKHNIKNHQDWINAKNSGLIPSNIPKYPWEVYAKTKNRKK